MRACREAFGVVPVRGKAARTGRHAERGGLPRNIPPPTSKGISGSKRASANIISTMLAGRPARRRHTP